MRAMTDGKYAKGVVARVRWQGCGVKSDERRVLREGCCAKDDVREGGEEAAQAAGAWRGVEGRGLKD